MPVMIAKPYLGHNQDWINPFIEQFVRNIQTHNRSHYTACFRNWGYSHHNLLYRERTIYSLMSAAMHKLTPIHQSESSVIKRIDRRIPRNRGRERDQNGRVDLWAYKDGIDYYFEFKRSYVGMSSLLDGYVPGRVHRPWTNLVEQIGQVRNSPDIGNEPDTCCIGMQIITPYKRGTDRDNLRNQEQVRSDELENFIEQFRRTPDTVLWYRTDRLSRIIPIEWDENENESKWVLHPCHLFLFKIFST